MRRNGANLNKENAFKEQQNSGRKYCLKFGEKLGKNVCMYLYMYTCVYKVGGVLQI